MMNATCAVCKKTNIPATEIDKTVAGGHGKDYLYWHKETACEKGHAGAIIGFIDNIKEIEFSKED